jgi:L-serine deaminase
MCDPSTMNSSPIKSCMKRPSQASIADSRGSLRDKSLREVLRRVSSRRASISEVLRSQGTESTIEMSSSSHTSDSFEHRPSESCRTLFFKLGGSSRQVFAEKTDERKSIVRFSDVSIREYDITASHHPGGRACVPIEVRCFEVLFCIS